VSISHEAGAVNVDVISSPVPEANNNWLLAVGVGA
jgi:hypothetical protein